MTKPWWVEEWVLDAADPESGPVIGLKDGGVLFDCNDATRARGAHAAPDMARALLLDLGEYGHTMDCSYMVTVGGTVTCSSPMCRQKRAALTKAGVPLP